MSFDEIFDHTADVFLFCDRAKGGVEGGLFWIYIFLFERSEVLIATIPPQNSVICACVRVSCVRLILLLLGKKIHGFSLYLYVLCTTYVLYLVSAGYPDTYVPGISRQTNVQPVDAHVWRQLHVSAVARCSDSYYCIFCKMVTFLMVFFIFFFFKKCDLL